MIRIPFMVLSKVDFYDTFSLSEYVMPELFSCKHQTQDNIHADTSNPYQRQAPKGRPAQDILLITPYPLCNHPIIASHISITSDFSSHSLTSLPCNFDAHHPCFLLGYLEVVNKSPPFVNVRKPLCIAS